jgi:hypothetical protein
MTALHNAATLCDPLFFVAAVPRLYPADDGSGAANGSAIGVLVPNRRASSTGVNPNTLKSSRRSALR